MISTDRKQVVNWELNSSKPFDALFSYTCNNSNTSVKSFLCHSAPGNYRISTINDETITDKTQKNEPYKPQICHVRQKLKPENFYTLVLSSFNKNEDLGGKLKIESN